MLLPELTLGSSTYYPKGILKEDANLYDLTWGTYSLRSNPFSFSPPCVYPQDYCGKFALYVAMRLTTFSLILL